MMDQMSDSNDRILEKAYELGVKYEKECTGCAQTVVAAIFEALGIWSDDVFKAASGLANGLGLTGDGSCAALLGASMVISYIFGREHKDFEEMYKPMKSYGLVKKLHNKFLREYGGEINSCRCSDVQKGLMGVTWDIWSLNEMDDSFKTQMIDSCSKLVGNIAKLATEIILENGYAPE
jgi:C_GCAxxG_C_C family probable redox protein